jgi:hypothetical protein
MSWLQIAALVVLIVSLIVSAAARGLANQEAAYLSRIKAKRADDPRFKEHGATLHPAPDLDLIWGPEKELPSSLRKMTSLYRLALTIMYLAGGVILLTTVFDK